MAATVTGAKTVTKAVAPHLSAATLTTLLGTAIENLTVAQFYEIKDALDRIAKGEEPTSAIGSLFV